MKDDEPSSSVSHSAFCISRLRVVRVLTALFIVGLILSGLTAIPIQTQLDLAARLGGLENVTDPAQTSNAFSHWLVQVRTQITHLNRTAPYILYGNDWLAFGHVGIALVFFWALRRPLKYKFLYDYGLLLCLMVIPWAAVCGALRGIPWWWRCIDSSFGLLGAVPLLVCKRLLSRIEMDCAKSTPPGR